jgi:hypothetical protein
MHRMPRSHIRTGTIICYGYVAWLRRTEANVRAVCRYCPSGRREFDVQRRMRGKCHIRLGAHWGSESKGTQSHGTPKHCQRNLCRLTGRPVVSSTCPDHGPVVGEVASVGTLTYKMRRLVRDAKEPNSRADCPTRNRCRSPSMHARKPPCGAAPQRHGKGSALPSIKSPCA